MKSRRIEKGDPVFIYLFILYVSTDFIGEKEPAVETPYLERTFRKLTQDERSHLPNARSKLSWLYQLPQAVHLKKSGQPLALRTFVMFPVKESTGVFTAVNMETQNGLWL